MCVDAPGSYHCRCALGFTGTNCDMEIDECSSHPCSTMGTTICIDEIGSFRCSCSPGWLGALCEVSHNPCQDPPDPAHRCDVNAVCQHAGPGQYSCGCAAGWETIDIGLGPGKVGPSRPGGACIDINECTAAGLVCENGGTCLESGCLDSVVATECPATLGVRLGGNAMGMLECICTTGWLGTFCGTVDVDECNPTNGTSPCHNGGQCFDSHDEPTTLGEGEFQCDCIAGYEGNICEHDCNAEGTLCDDCTPNPCENNGVCTDNGWQSFTCVCTTGYSGSTCGTDVDECSTPAWSGSPCRNGGDCQESSVNPTIPIGAYNCDCAEGFTGAVCEDDVDECASNPCGAPPTRCDNGAGIYSCACAIPRCSNGGTCSVVQDTVTGKLSSSEYRCQCQLGFSGLHCDRITTAEQGG
eukprot:SAG31_NODE_3186_length_4575_cov_2.905496_2_plen_412_part_00